MTTKQYQELIIKVLKEFAKAANITLTKDDIDVLRWSGLQETEAFKKEFNTIEKKQEWEESYKKLERYILFSYDVGDYEERYYVNEPKYNIKK